MHIKEGDLIMLEKIKDDELFGHKIGLIVGIILGLLTAIFVSSKADEYVIEESLEEVEDEKPAE